MPNIQKQKQFYPFEEQKLVIKPVFYQKVLVKSSWKTRLLLCSVHPFVKGLSFSQSLDSSVTPRHRFVFLWLFTDSSMNKITQKHVWPNWRRKEAEGRSFAAPCRLRVVTAGAVSRRAHGRLCTGVRVNGCLSSTHLIHSFNDLFMHACIHSFIHGPYDVGEESRQWWRCFV